MKSFMEQYNQNIPEPVTEKTAKTAEDFLNLAEAAPNSSSAYVYAGKALKLDPDNLDAERIMAECSAQDMVDLLKKLNRAVKHGNQIMEKEGYLAEDNIGHFWGMFETRPYMRLRRTYIMALLECGMMRKAVDECEEMLRLCEQDNLGIRYILMHLYTYLEEEEKALDLYKRFDKSEEIQFLLPLSILYFKKDDLDTADKYLKQLIRINRDTGKFIKGIVNNALEQHIRNRNEYGYKPFTVEEFITELLENSFLLENVPAYYAWAEAQLKRKKK